jgi:hypothetical protein
MEGKALVGAPLPSGKLQAKGGEAIDHLLDTLLHIEEKVDFVQKRGETCLRNT